MKSGSSTGNQRSLILLTVFIMGLLALIAWIGMPEAGGEDPDAVVQHEVRIINLTTFTMDSSFLMHAHEGRDAHQLRQFYANASAWEREDLVADLGGAALQHDMEVLRILFNGSYDYQTEAHLDMDTLTDPDLPPDTPILISVNGSASLSRSTYDLPAEADLDDVVHGTLKMGAVVRLRVNLIAPENALATYRFTPMPGTVIDPATTGILGHNYASWSLDNRSGAVPSRSEYLLFRGEATNPVPHEDIRATIVIDREQFELTRVYVEFEIRSLRVSRFGNLSDSIVSLDHISADGIRMVLDNGLVNYSLDRLYDHAIIDNKNATEAAISQALNTTVGLDIGWIDETLSGYDINFMGSDQAVIATMRSGDITPQLYAMGIDDFGPDDLRVAKGFLNAGGKAEFDIPVISLDLGVTPMARLILSPGMRLENQTGLERQEPDHRYAYSWNPRNEFRGRIYAAHAREYNDSNIQINVTVDISEIRINWLAWRSSSLKIDVFGNLLFYRMELPRELAENLPAGITIDYVIADLLRLAYDTGLLNITEIESMIDKETRKVERDLRDAITENVFLSVTIDMRSLQGYDIDDMKDFPAVRVNGNARISISVDDLLDDGGKDDAGTVGAYGSWSIPGRNLVMATFLSTVLRDWSFDFSTDPVEEWDLNVQIILPRGIVITHVSDDLGLASRGTVDGRHYLMVLMTDAENTITVGIGITPMLFIDICFLPIVLILLVVVLLIHRRRTKRRKRKLKERRKVRIRGSVPATFSQKQNPPADHHGPPSMEGNRESAAGQRPLTPEPHRLPSGPSRGAQNGLPGIPPPSSPPPGFDPREAFRPVDAPRTHPPNQHQQMQGGFAGPHHGQHPGVHGGTPPVPEIPPQWPQESTPFTQGARPSWMQGTPTSHPDIPTGSGTGFPPSDRPSSPDTPVLPGTTLPTVPSDYGPDGPDRERKDPRQGPPDRGAP